MKTIYAFTEFNNYGYPGFFNVSVDGDAYRLLLRPSKCPDAVSLNISREQLEALYAALRDYLATE